jgi:enoyl-CoA hydratase/carnithine racemase
MIQISDHRPRHFSWDLRDRIATIRLDGPTGRTRSPSTATPNWGAISFRALAYASEWTNRVVRVERAATSARAATSRHHRAADRKADEDLLAFTRMTGDLVKAMLSCGKPVIAAVDGVAVGAGAIIAMAADLGLPRRRRDAPSCSHVWALRAATWAPAPCCPHHRPGPRGGAPLHRTDHERRGGSRLGFWNALHAPESLDEEARALALRLAQGPTFAHSMTKTSSTRNGPWD